MVAGAEEGEPVCEGVEGQGSDAEGSLGGDRGRVLPRHARVRHVVLLKCVNEVTSKQEADEEIQENGQAIGGRWDDRGRLLQAFKTRGYKRKGSSVLIIEDEREPKS